MSSKISALPAATTPLTGTEQIPLVQGGTTCKTPVSELMGGLSGIIGPLPYSATETPPTMDFTVDLTALGLTAAPRGAHVSVVIPNASAPGFNARMNKALTTATSLAIHCDAFPAITGYYLAWTLVL